MASEPPHDPGFPTRTILMVLAAFLLASALAWSFMGRERAGDTNAGPTTKGQAPGLTMPVSK
jgi:hypothetical protein